MSSELVLQAISIFPGRLKLISEYIHFSNYVSEFRIFFSRKEYKYYEYNTQDIGFNPNRLMYNNVLLNYSHI